MLALTITGKPMPCPRPRCTRKGRVYMPASYQLHKQSLVMDMRRAKILQNWIPSKETPLKLTIHFLFKRPVRIKNQDVNPIPKPTKPDIDNLTKTIMDALQDAEVIIDDRQIVHIDSKKWYARKGEQAHTNILLEVIK